MGELALAGRDKLTFVVDEPVSSFGLWVEQLIAESTGKHGKGLIPAPGESPDGPDRQAADVGIADPYALAGEFFRWEFAVAVAGSFLEINPFDQPDVQAAKDKTSEVLSTGQDPSLELEGTIDRLVAQANEGDYLCVQAFVEPNDENDRRIADLVQKLRRQSGLVVTHGYGPRYLHSTGQLHKGGPNTGLFLQVVDDPGEELPIPGQPFGFRRLIQAQAAGDFASLRDRGRRVARVRLEDV
jgi:transaldolase / glucose-6-phosphate isomerase